MSFPQSVAPNPGAMFAHAVCYSSARVGAEPALSLVQTAPKAKTQKAPPPPDIRVVDTLPDSHWHKPYLRVCHGNHNATEILGKLAFRYQRTPDGQPRLKVIRKSANGQPCFWFYHTRQELADECELTLDQVRYALAKLCEWGLIETRVNGAKVKGQKKSLFRLLIAEGAGSLNGWPVFGTPPAIGENSPLAEMPCGADGDVELSGEIPLSAIGEKSLTAIGEKSPIKAFKGVGSKGVDMKGVASPGVPPQGIQAEPTPNPDPGTTTPTPAPDTSPEVPEPAGWFVKPEKKLTHAELLARDEAWMAEHPIPVMSPEPGADTPMVEPAPCVDDPQPEQPPVEPAIENGQMPADPDAGAWHELTADDIARWVAAQPKPEPKPAKKMTCTA